MLTTPPYSGQRSFPRQQWRKLEIVEHPEPPLQAKNMGIVTPAQVRLLLFPFQQMHPTYGHVLVCLKHASWRRGQELLLVWVCINDLYGSSAGTRRASGYSGCKYQLSLDDGYLYGSSARVTSPGSLHHNGRAPPPVPPCPTLSARFGPCCSSEACHGQSPSSTNTLSSLAANTANQVALDESCALKVLAKLNKPEPIRKLPNDTICAARGLHTP